MTTTSNHTCSSGCSCAACRQQALETSSELPHWRLRRQQRLGSANPMQLPKAELEGEIMYPHQNFRQRKNVRHSPRYAPDHSEWESETGGGSGNYSGVAQAFLQGQRRAAQQLALMRRQLNLPPAGSPADRHTLAKLTIGYRSAYGINAHGQRVFLRVNPISRTHAEGDVFNQFAGSALPSDTGFLFLDRPMCRPCGVSGAVTSMARQIGLKKLVIIEPGASSVLSL